MNLSEIPFLPCLRSHTHTLALSSFSSSSSSSHPPSKLQPYISAPLMQLCHLDCLDVEAGEEEEGGKKKKTTAHKACLLCIKKIKAWNCLRPLLCLLYSLPLTHTYTNMLSSPVSVTYTNTFSRQHGLAEMGQDKSRQFLLSITR